MFLGKKNELERRVSNEKESGCAVIKLGGSVLKNNRDYIEAAGLVKCLKERYNHVVVVVSAQKGDTDVLIAAADELNLEGQEREEFLMIGEMNSAERMASILECDSYTQDREDFPLMASDSKKESDPLHYKKIFSEKIEPFKKEGISVIAGFGGRDQKGNPRIYGRGGSDTVAAQSARWLSECTSDSVDLYYVKDVGGIVEPGVNLDSCKDLSQNYIRQIDVKKLKIKVDSGEIPQVLHHKIFEMIDGEQYGRMNHGSRILIVGPKNYGEIGTEITL